MNYIDQVYQYYNNMSTKELKTLYKEFYQVIFISECYNHKDYAQFEIIEGILHQRGCDKFLDKVEEAPNA